MKQDIIVEMETLGQQATVKLNESKIDRELNRIRSWFESVKFDGYKIYKDKRYKKLNKLILDTAENQENEIEVIIRNLGDFDDDDLEALNSRLEKLALEKEFDSIYIERRVYLCGMWEMDHLIIHIKDDE
jgi:cobalamin biosynthesis Co2+ chelatase CbiK